jgi:DNA-binding XRE family transcriptional regulator
MRQDFLDQISRFFHSLLIAAWFLFRCVLQVCRMPRPPSISHPLRTARRILGLSQPQFGAQVGVSGITIQQIENHVMKMSPGLAQKIAITFGLDSDQLLAAVEPKRPRFFDGDTFTREGYEARKMGPRDFERKYVDPHVSNFTFTLEALLDAANETRHYGPFSTALTKRLSVLVEEFGLRGPLEEIFKAYGADPARRDFDTTLFRGPQIEGLLENRDKMRPWRYDELAVKPSISPIGPITPLRAHVPRLYQIADRSEEAQRPARQRRKIQPKPRRRKP